MHVPIFVHDASEEMTKLIVQFNFSFKDMLFQGDLTMKL